MHAWIVVVVVFSLKTSYHDSFILHYKMSRPFIYLLALAGSTATAFLLGRQNNIGSVGEIRNLKMRCHASKFENFDYESHWYPVSWACDLEPNEPTKVTVFDIDYVVAKTMSEGKENVICLEDKCMHKAAALSQGRVSSNGKNFQCAYHGWSFDGKSGECVEIPQLVGPDGVSAKIPSRSCAKAFPAQIHQGMVWIFPGGLEKALISPPPPTVNELEIEDDFKLCPYVRDFPVDWPILVSNIFDPDHGLFAHQAVAFDMYSASKDRPIDMEQAYPNDGKGWILNSKVDARKKLLEVDSKLRGKDDLKKKVKKNEKQMELWASSNFHAPIHLQLKRVDKTTGSTNFISTFYICPVGVGRSRFMAATISKFATPRWLQKLFTDNFVDQDTYLLATQQQKILLKEAKEIQTMIVDDPSFETLRVKSMKTRREMFCLTSPTEKVGARLEQFWDRTLLRVPNRIERILEMNAAGTFLTVPPREYVLDRKAQNLDICKDSRDSLANVQKLNKISKTVAIVLLAVKLFGKTPKTIASPTWFASTLGICYLTAYLTNKMERQFFFKYTEDYRKRDLRTIPKKVWIDKE